MQHAALSNPPFLKHSTPAVSSLKLVGSVEVLESDSNALGHGNLAGTDPHARIVRLLVGLVGAVRVANLAHEVVLLADHVITDTLGVGVLEVSVEVDLADTVADSIGKLLLAGSGTAVEDEEDGLLVLGASLLLDVLLVLAEELWAKLDVAGLVDTVDVTESSGNGEVRGDLGQSLVDLVNVFGLGVEGVVVDRLVVNTVLLTTGDTNLLFMFISN